MARRPSCAKGYVRKGSKCIKKKVTLKVPANGSYRSVHLSTQVADYKNGSDTCTGQLDVTTGDPRRALMATRRRVVTPACG